MEDEGLDSDADAQDSDAMTVDEDTDDGDDEDLGKLFLYSNRNYLDVLFNLCHQCIVHYKVFFNCVFWCQMHQIVDFM